MVTLKLWFSFQRLRISFLLVTVRSWALLFFFISLKWAIIASFGLILFRGFTAEKSPDDVFPFDDVIFCYLRITRSTATQIKTSFNDDIKEGKRWNSLRWSRSAVIIIKNYSEIKAGNGPKKKIFFRLCQGVGELCDGERDNFEEVLKSCC